MPLPMLLHDESGSWKACANGYQDSWLIHTNNSIWRWPLSFAALWRRSKLTGEHCHWQWHVGAPFDAESKGPSRGWEHPGSPWKKEVQKHTSTKKSCEPSYRIRRGLFWNFIKKKIRLLAMQHAQPCLKTKWNLQFATKEKDCCRKLFSCTTTILTSMSRLQQCKRFEISSLRLCHIHLAVPTLHHATFMPLDHLQKHYVVTSLDVIKWKKWHICGFRNKQKPSSLIESGNLWTISKRVWNCWETMLRSNITVTHISLCL